jgi:hypothetical protein
VPDRGAATRALLAMSRDTADDRTLAGRICRACASGLDVDGAAISIHTASAARQTLAATDETAIVLEELQFTLNEGACVAAATTGNPVLVPDLLHSTEVERWPVFAAAVAERTQVRALFAIPLQWGAVNLGVLDLYRRAPGRLDDTRQRDALDAAGIATLMLLSRLTDPDGRRDDRLDSTVLGRAEIHQATGMVLAQLDIAAPDALARLRGHAFAHDRLLVDVARDVVARRLRFDEDRTQT